MRTIKLNVLVEYNFPDETMDCNDAKAMARVDLESCYAHVEMIEVISDETRTPDRTES